jgi:hypothetical protein
LLENARIEHEVAIIIRNKDGGIPMMLCHDLLDSEGRSEKETPQIQQLSDALKKAFKKEGTVAFPRLRLWEMCVFFKCPVMGLSLSLAEQKRLLKKAGYVGERKNTYEIHEVLVSCCDDENSLSRKADNLLGRKYKSEMRQAVALDEKAFLQYWRDCFESGEWKGALWTVAIHPRLSLSARLVVFGDVHMAMHDNAGQICRLKQQLSSWQKECRQLSQRFKEVTLDKKQLYRENQTLEDACETFRAEQARLEAEKQNLAMEINRLKNGQTAQLEAENRHLLEDVESLMEEKKTLARQRAELEREKERLTDRLDQQLAVNEDLKSEMQTIDRWVAELKELKALTQRKCNADCPSFDLCQKRVLIVGGITRMETAYRRLIESSGGIFDYHDGYMKKGNKKLQESLKRADVVLCPVSCNSHGACLAVKKLAKKHNKAVHMLPTSSLSAVSEAIRADDGGGDAAIRCT